MIFVAIPILVFIISNCSVTQINTKPKSGDYTYKTKEYNGIVWMTENLKNVTDSVGNKIKYFIPNNDSSNIKNYGLLYDYETACKVCPTGWHLPTDKEWEKLINFVGNKSGNELKDSIYWKTSEKLFSNKSGFSIRPAGYGNTGEFDNLFGSHSIFWSSTKVDTHFVKGFVITLASDSMRSAPQHPTYGFSVRCVKNRYAEN